MTGALPEAKILWIALFYSLGAHGIMTLNDFKSIEGDQQSGIRSLPAMLGADVAAQLACVVMIIPQIAVIIAMLCWGHCFTAAAVVLLCGAQFLLMQRLLDSPRERAPWYNGTGTTLYVLGMLICAFALAVGHA